MKNINKYKKLLTVLAIIILGGLSYTIIKSTAVTPRQESSPASSVPESRQTNPPTQESAPSPSQEKMGSLVYRKSLKNQDVVEIHKIDLDGKNDKLIFTDVDEDFRIRLVDGLFKDYFLIFATALNENIGAVWKIQTDGSGSKKQLVGQISTSSFASNGKKISFISYDNIDGTYNIWLMNLDGRFKTKVLSSETVVTDVIFIDDVLAFVKIDNDNNSSIIKINPDGSKQEEIIKVKDKIINSLFYASDKFAYIKASKGDAQENLNEVYLYDLKSKSERRITNDKQKDSFPIISPDGKRIAISKNGKIWVGNIDGTGLKEIAEGDQPIGFLE